MTNKNNKENIENALWQEYIVLVDIVKNQHVRIQDYNKTFLTINAILVSAISFLLKENKSEFFKYILVISIFSLIICSIWILVMRRIHVDTELRWFQDRNIERMLPTTYKIFTEGYDFFNNKNKKNLKAFDGNDSIEYIKSRKWKFVKFRVISAGVVIPALFILLYIVLILFAEKC